jgi:hypothetical protein
MSKSINDFKNIINDVQNNDEIGNDASQIIINALNDTNMVGFTGESIDDLETDDIY